MKKLFLVIGISLVLTDTAIAQFYPEGPNGGTQWKAVQGNLAQFIAAGFKLVGVINSTGHEPSAEMNETITYYLQGDTGLVRCDEQYLGGDFSKRLEAGKNNQPLPPMIFPSASFRCFSPTLPHAESPAR